MEVHSRMGAVWTGSALAGPASQLDPFVSAVG